MFELTLLPHQYFARTILRLFTVRIHSGLIEKGRPWLKLWYLLRGLDIQGSGFAKVSMHQVCQLLWASSSTVRQWLREGKAAGAFRFWRCNQRQGLRVALSSLHQLCSKLGLTNVEKPSREQQMWSGLRRGLTAWGAVAEIPLFQIHQLRPLATAAVTQKLQQRSRHAAWQALPEEIRENWNLPEPEEFFRPEASPRNKGLKLKASQSAPSDEQEQRPSDDTACGGIRCLVHIGKKRIFVSKGFIPFGTSQDAIAWERNYESDRTIQRHLAQVNLPHKQIVQAKAAYGHLRKALQWDSPGIAPEPGISLSRLLDGRNVLSEISGTVGDKPYTQEVTAERFFRYGDRDWIYRCNLYKPELQLRTTRYSIRNYRRLLTKSKKISRLQGVDGFKEFHSEAGKDRHFS